MAGIDNSCPKFNDVRYSVVRSTVDERVSGQTEDGTMKRGFEYQPRSIENTCSCVNMKPCVCLKYAPHLTTVAELEMENVSNVNSSNTFYS